ncbi:MAG: hypothetical protein ACI9N9_001649 [Enterobacterales bacterium]|jgi:hypothetical protein
MKITFIPITKLSFFLYLAGALLLAFAWFDQWQQLYLVSDTFRAQLFIISIIIIAIAAIVNLTTFIFSNYLSSSKPPKKNSPSDGH